MRAWWVGVQKGKWSDHKVFEFDGDPEPTDTVCQGCDYVIGPFKNKEEAVKRAGTEHNQTGWFTDPFGPQPHGR